MDFALSEDNEGEYFNSKGREFQHLGAIVLIECLSERITKKFFFCSSGVMVMIDPGKHRRNNMWSHISGKFKREYSDSLLI